ncbi:MAG: radical SAM protein [bacterium]
MPLNVGLLNLPCLMARKTLSYFEGAPPLGLAYIAGSLRAAGYTPVVLDALGEGCDRYSLFPSLKGDLLVQGYGIDDIVDRLPEGLDVLGIGHLFLHELRFLQALLPRLKARFPDTAIVLGGETATGMWDELLRMLPEVTACILGEGEQAFLALLRSWERGTGLAQVSSLAYRVDGVPRQNARAARARDIDAIPWPAWDLFPVERYLEAGIRSGVNRGRSMPLLTSRGCPFTCAFCSAPTMWGTTYVGRDPAMLLDEIESLMRRYQVTNFDLRDLSAALSKGWIRRFHAEVMSRGARFTWQIPQGTRSESLDGESLRLMYEAGCRNFGYALESTSPAVITRMRKKVVPARLMASVREALRLPLHVEIFFIIGYPGETTADHLSYLRAIVRLAWMGAQALSVMQFNPYPGSADFFRLRDEGRIDFADDDYVYSSLFRTTGQSPSVQSHFSTRHLVVFQYLCLVLFWGLQFLFRPWRLARLVWNLLNVREETILEQFLVVKTRQWLRLRGKRQAPPPLAHELPTAP